MICWQQREHFGRGAVSEHFWNDCLVDWEYDNIVRYKTCPSPGLVRRRVHDLITWGLARMVSSVALSGLQQMTGDFLGYLKSYVREEDGCCYLEVGGGLCLLIFCLEWVVLVLAFLLTDCARRGGTMLLQKEMEWRWFF
ncbi:hypothetical protein D5086_033718 [Populus alba]|uniref:Uncharacterized protein n=1 Tax=Populus alba TaxID=43335 RepID=A0ACC4AIH5_POPAL